MDGVNFTTYTNVTMQQQPLAKLLFNNFLIPWPNVIRSTTLTCTSVSTPMNCGPKFHSTFSQVNITSCRNKILNVPVCHVSSHPLEVTTDVVNSIISSVHKDTPRSLPVSTFISYELVHCNYMYIVHVHVLCTCHDC